MADPGRQDLNLLVVLQVLLEEGGVSSAARRLGLSQSAVSHALSRLRRAFGDPLLIRDGNVMRPTPRAEALRADLARVLADAGALYELGPAFVPQESRRRFVVAASDLLGPVVPELVRAVSAEAPHVRIVVQDQVRLSDPNLFGSGGVDVALSPFPQVAPGLVARRVGAMSFAVLARTGHPFLAAPTLDLWCQTPHVVVSTGRPGVGYVGAAVDRLGLHREVMLEVPSFLLAVHVVAETHLLFTAPRALLRSALACLPLELAPVPFELAEVPVAAVWHERFATEPGHRWFRERLAEVVGSWIGIRSDT